jgi:hypothetical protein
LVIFLSKCVIIIIFSVYNFIVPEGDDLQLAMQEIGGEDYLEPVSYELKLAQVIISVLC